MASTYLTRTVGTPTNSKKFTFSCWVKLTKLDSSVVFLGNYADNNNRSELGLSGGNLMQYYARDGGSTYVDMYTTRTLRDMNAWYNLIWAVDTTQATASDRVKFYINGVQETVFTGENYPSQNTDLRLNTSGQVINIGRLPSDTKYVDGLMSHIHFCDGSQLAPTVFGETDNTTGEWKIITDPSFTLGNNGFTILKDGNTITDQSSNSNNFTLGGGTLTKTEDNPSNVFATLQGLFLDNNDLTLSNGLTKAVEGSDNWRSAYSSLGASSGKFYCEAKVTYQNNTEAYVGVSHEDHLNGTASFGGSWGGVQNSGYDYVGYSDKSVSIYSNGDQDYPSGVTVGDTWQSSGDIMSIAMDLDNNKVYFAKNGVWADGSGGWGSSTFNSSTGGQTIVSGLTFFGFSPNQSTFEVNFGNGYFGTTAVSSAGTNASGIGIFEYDVPTGYTALSTKGLNL